MFKKSEGLPKNIGEARAKYFEGWSTAARKAKSKLPSIKTEKNE